MPVLESIAKAVGLGTNEDPHKAERSKLPTLADVEAAEANLREASRALEAGRAEVTAGSRWPGSLKPLEVAFSNASHRCTVIRQQLHERRDLAPVEIRERYRRHKQVLVRLTTERQKLQHGLQEHDRDHAKLIAAEASAKYACVVAATGDKFTQADAVAALERAQRALVASSLAREELIEQIDANAQSILEAEKAVSAANSAMLNA